MASLIVYGYRIKVEEKAWCEEWAVAACRQARSDTGGCVLHPNNLPLTREEMRAKLAESSMPD